MIRFVKNEDWGPWKVLWQGYLDFYREELPEDVSRRTFERLRDQRDGLFGLVAETDEGELVGIANALVHPTTWSEAGYCYLEDLFVTPRAGRGGARLLSRRFSRRLDGVESSRCIGTHRSSTVRRGLCTTFLQSASRSSYTNTHSETRV